MSKIFQIKETILMGPGPSSVSPNVYKALSSYTVGHLDPRFIEIMDEIKQFIKVYFFISYNDSFIDY